MRAYVNRKFGGKNRDINLLMARDERWVTSRSRRVGKRLSVRLYYIRHFSLKTFGLMHFTVIDTPIMSPTKGFLVCVSLSGPSMTLLW